MDLLLITDENNSHYDFNRFMYNKSKIRIKRTFADTVYNVLVVKKSCKNIKSLFENKW